MLSAGVGRLPMVSFSVDHEREAFIYANMPNLCLGAFLEEYSLLYIDAGTTAYRMPDSLFHKMMIHLWKVWLAKMCYLKHFGNAAVSVLLIQERQKETVPVHHWHWGGEKLFPAQSHSKNASFGSLAFGSLQLFFGVVYKTARTPFSELAGVCWARMGDLLELVGPSVRCHCGSLC